MCPEELGLQDSNRAGEPRAGRMLRGSREVLADLLKVKKFVRSKNNKSDSSQERGVFIGLNAHQGNDHHLHQSSLTFRVRKCALG